ncbi:Per1-like protein, partial [Tricharina praecox]|uniref:Per1-like protein n=1 Tax=Tricharina praecox TaxID=43433 RepID=UPI002220994F
LAVLLLSLLVLVLFTTDVLASRGDKLPEFKACVETCIETECLLPNTLPLHLRLLLWTCPSNCDYICQRTITQSRLHSGQSIEQFHGKWPFQRLLGLQEPFSVLFSLLNGYAHLRGLCQLRRELPPSHPMTRYYILFSYVGLGTWTCSALFHARDTVLTERLDYFGAGANVLYGLYYAPVRVLRLWRPRFRRGVRAWGWTCIAAYAAHVYYLQFVRWDYTYNMAANVVVGAAMNVLWTYFSVTQYSRHKRFWAAWPGLIVTWLIMAMSLELLDFPPVADAIDAHALWHAATIIPAMWWYRFL